MSVTADLSIQFVWAIANTEANLAGEKTIRPLHFYLGILKLVDPRFLKQLHGVDIPDDEKLTLAQLSKDVRHYLEMTVEDITKVRRSLRAEIREGKPQRSDIHMLHRSEDSRQIFQAAMHKVVQTGGKTLSALHLAESLFESGAINLDGQKRPHASPSSKGAKWEVVEDGKSQKGKQFSSWFGRNLLQLAEESSLSPFAGRDHEMKTMLRVLSRTRKRHIAIIGDPGVGKTALVEGLARAIAEKKVPKDLNNYEVLELHGSDISSDCKSEAVINRRVSHLFRMLSNHKSVILFLDDFHGLFPGHLKPDSTFALLSTLLSSDGPPVIITTLLEKWKELTANAPSLLRRFEVVQLNDPSSNDCRLMADAWTQSLTLSQGIAFSPDAVAAIIKAASDLPADRGVVDRIVDLVENLSTYSKVSALSSNKGRRTVTPEDVASVLSEYYGVRSVRAPRAVGDA